MSNENRHCFATKSTWLATFSLVTVLYLIYSPTFLTDYLMNDEWALIGGGSLNIMDLPYIAARSFLYYGRGLFGVYETLVYGFVDYDPFRIQFVRFINFASFAVIAVVLLWFTEKRSNNINFAFFIVLLLFSQPAFQGAMGYSLQLISNTLPAMWLSLMAFYLHFYTNKKGKFSKLLMGGAVFLLLILAMQSTQTYAFFALVPLSYLALTDWDSRKYKIFHFLGIAIAVFLISAFLYRIGLEFLGLQGQEGYDLGVQGFATIADNPIEVILIAVNPLSYWSAFKIWTYPFPLHYTLPLEQKKRIIAAIVMIIWTVIILGSIFAELRGRSINEKQQRLLKWFIVLICLGFAGVFLVADSPREIIEHRPHLTMTFVGIVIFSAAYSIQVLTSKYQVLRNKLTIYLGIALVMLIAFGAQAGVLRGIVNNRMEQISFIRTELSAKKPADYNDIIVVLPGWSGCITEPCGPWMGRATSDEWHVTREGVYRYALETIDVPSERKEITFMDQKPDRIPNDSIIIDWNQYASARNQHFESLRNDE